MKMQHDEMNVILEGTKNRQSKLGISLKKFCTKDQKARFIRKVVDGKDVVIEKMVKQMMSLKMSAMKVVRSSPSKIPKERLNNIAAALLFGAKEKQWREEAVFKTEAEIQNVGKTSWFSYPEFNDERQKMERKCLDAHHLLVNLRSKVCKDGLLGIRKEAWHSVAESRKDIISKGIVVDLLDKQNNAFAKRTFSLDVENEMRNLNFLAEADFCKLIRQWYDAEESAGLSATERIRRNLDLKDYLLKEIEFGTFPPPGMYIKGFPKIMYEGFLQRIDTSIQLHAILESRSYNHRSLSSLVNETFFGELSELEPTKLGCPKAVIIPRLMSNVTEMQHFRCDPSDRAFHICTARRSVYPSRKLLENEEMVDQDDQEEESLDNKDLTRIAPRNHTFDAPERLGKPQRKSKQSDISKPNQVSRGVLPIRQHHKCDESKILATTRLGISLYDN